MKGPAPLIRTQACTKETLEEERLSYLKSRHAAMEYGEVRGVVAQKPGVGDHTPERFADHEASGGSSAFRPEAMDWKSVKRLLALT